MAKKTLRKREPGTGQIVPRGDNKYLLRVFIGRDGDGKKRYASKTVTGTISQARQALTALQREADTGTAVVQAKQSVRQYLETWLEGKLDILPQTRQKYQSMMTTYVYGSGLARMKLTDVKRVSVQGLYNEMVEKGYSARTIQYVHSILRQSFEVAVVDNILARNPADHTTRPKTGKGSKVVKASVLTPEETNKLLEATKGTPYHALWMLMLTTGMRPQEAIPLRWSDMKGNEVHINRVLAMVGNKKVVQEGRAKTEGSVRAVSLPEVTLRALKAHRIEQNKARLACGEEWQDNDLVFAGRQGRMKEIHTLRRNWRAALEGAGLDRRRLYDARHSHITHLVEAGVPAAVIAERVGNSANIVLSVYTHILDETKKNLAGKTQEILYPSQAPERGEGEGTAATLHPTKSARASTA